ncbi:MAG: PQQ-binding-like beta-propeller repeat protein [Gemmatimonadota bacterium]|nr:PQQ-binding-like beta-propeller repeat protein [Gemmatimonadota bacterium]MDH5284549.1 PQQ-binding-like beta-propeller repeat protein [Gemmatimonadota bacterium]
MERCRGRRAWSLAALLVSVNACGPAFRPVQNFIPGEVRTPEPIDSTPLTLLWRSRPFRGPSAPIAHDDTIAFLGGSDRKVVALDLPSGGKRWSHRLGGPLLGGVLFDGTTVYAATSRPDGRVRAFDPRSGNKLWEVHTGDVDAPLALADETIVVVTQHDGTFGLASKTGAIRWRARFGSSQVAPVPLAGGDVLVTSHDSLFRIHARDGLVLFRRQAPAAIVGPWSHHATTLVAASGDSLLVAIRPDSLNLAWSVPLDGPLLGPPGVVGDTVYALTQPGSLYRVILGDSTVTESLGTPTWPPTVGPVRFGDVVLLGGSDGVMRAVGASDGLAAWELKIGRPVALPPIRLSDGTLLLVGGRGDVWRVR